MPHHTALTLDMASQGWCLTHLTTLVVSLCRCTVVLMYSSTGVLSPPPPPPVLPPPRPYKPAASTQRLLPQLQAWLVHVFFRDHLLQHLDMQVGGRWWGGVLLSL